MITKVIAAVLATVAAEVFISNADLRHAASKVVLVAASASPLTLGCLDCLDDQIEVGLL